VRRQGSAVNVERNARNPLDSTLTALSAVNVEFARKRPLRSTLSPVSTPRCPRLATAPRNGYAAAPSSSSAFKTASSCVLGEAFGITCATVPPASMMNVDRCAPQ
jgi:hypothetical protein